MYRTPAPSRASVPTKNYTHLYPYSLLQKHWRVLGNVWGEWVGEDAIRRVFFSPRLTAQGLGFKGFVIKCALGWWVGANLNDTVS